MPRTLLVVLSGGCDSTICLFWAKQNAETLHTITFDYGQRHKSEVEAAAKIAQIAGVESHEAITLPEGILKGSSPLINPESEVGHYKSTSDLPGGVEPTFVPARNALFLTVAANRANLLQAHGIVAGVCMTDYGGYPDCRAEFIAMLSSALDLGIYGDSQAPNHPILTPLMHLTKRQSVLLARELPGCWDALAFTQTSYDGDYPPNPFNHASLLRARGFHEAQLPDPLIERAIKEGLLPTDYPTDGDVENTRFGDPAAWSELVKVVAAPEPKRRKKTEPEQGELFPATVTS